MKPIKITIFCFIFFCLFLLSCTSVSPKKVILQVTKQLEQLPGYYSLFAHFHPMPHSWPPNGDGLIDYYFYYTEPSNKYSSRYSDWIYYPCMKVTISLFDNNKIISVVKYEKKEMRKNMVNDFIPKYYTENIVKAEERIFEMIRSNKQPGNKDKILLQAYLDYLEYIPLVGEFIIKEKSAFYNWLITDRKVGDLILDPTDRISDFHANGMVERLEIRKKRLIMGKLCSLPRVHFFPNGKILAYRLSQNEEYNNLWYKANKIIQIYENGKVDFGYLLHDTKVDNYLFKADHRISFHPNGKLQSGYLAHEHVINGIHVQGYDKGYKYERSPYKIELYDNGQIYLCYPSRDQLIQGYQVIHNQEINFHKNGQLKMCILAVDQIIHGKQYYKQEVIHISEKGQLIAHSKGNFFINKLKKSSQKNK